MRKRRPAPGGRMKKMVRGIGSAGLLAALLLSLSEVSRASPREAPLSAAPPAFSDALEPAAILRAMSAAADWQLQNPSKWEPTLWHPAAFWAGMSAFAPLSEDAKYLEAIRQHGVANEWRLAARPFHADDQSIAQSYFALYILERDRRMIAPTLERFGRQLENAYDEPLAWDNEVHHRELAWCDALFMQPTALAIATTATGDKRYLELANRLWWKTTAFLYDKEEKLYFRDSRFFEPREPNGKKVFWSRGNGWVLAGLVRVLQNMPLDFPDRPRYLALYREMSVRIAALQGKDGYWRASLLDPDSVPNPETSGTAFFTYALAWGVNQGLLDRAICAPVIRRGWSALVRALHPDGKLGWVQRVGDRPGDTSADGTEIYGVGALLLAGSELYRTALVAGAPFTTRALRNPLDEARFDEVVELPLTRAERPAGAAAKTRLVVVDGRSGAFVPSQTDSARATGPAGRQLVLVSLLAGEARPFRVYRLPAAAKLPPVRVLAFGRHVPERKDDFAWENDRIAFRVYGPALQATGEISSGIDVWAKRVRYPVIDRWYKGDDYHKDHGEGLDFYKVGPSRGCRGVALWKDGKLAASANYTAWKLVASGPLRVAFELTYDAWGLEGMKHAETKRISLDAGSNLSRIEVRFDGKGKPVELPLAVGFERRGEGTQTVAPDRTWASFWEPPQGQDGQIGCGVVLPRAATEVVDAGTDTLLASPHASSKPFVYHAGAAWSKGLDFQTPDEWNEYLRTFTRRQAAPIALALKDKAHE